MSQISDKTEREMQEYCKFFTPCQRCTLGYNGRDFINNKITLVLYYEEYTLKKTFDLTPGSTSHSHLCSE